MSEGQQEAPASPVSATDETSNLLHRADRRQPQLQCLPISTQLLGSLAGGMYCRDCRRSDVASPPSSPGAPLLRALLGPTTPLHGRHDQGDDDDHNDNNNPVSPHHDYDLQALARQNSAVISPLVLAPMLQPSENISLVERILTEYSAACKLYGCADRVNAGVLTTVRFSLPSLRVGGDFHDADMLALAELLLRHANGALRYIKRLDFSRASKEGKLHGGKGFRSHGALTLSKVLQQTKYIEEVRMDGNRLGPYGSSAIFLACSKNPSLKRLVMRSCLVGERGGLVLAELISDTKSHLGPLDIDLSVNRIGFLGSLAIERALLKRQQRDRDDIFVDLSGNLVLQEIMNGVTHGLGILLAMIGAFLMSNRVKDRSHRHILSCGIYSTSLLVLYTSSTLYHSFFALQNARYVFEVMDKCAIYILIAGSYTPFVTIMAKEHIQLATAMLSFVWFGALAGVFVEFNYPTWKRKGLFSLAMYLGLGWSVCVAPQDAIDIIPRGAVNLIVLGGVAYTGGVPFFIRNNFLDHSIWHLFVLLGSFFHWAALYFYIVLMP